MQVYDAFLFSIWQPVAFDFRYFLVYAIDGLGGGGSRRNTPALCVLKNVLTRARSWLSAKDSNSSPWSLRVSRL